ncbi:MULTISPECIES: SHOCT domain-containing protein [Gordonia]|uniref:SHOCT domain-containing protein n=3 Tax=Gordonia alkanivorans TaxID=84096 RepID=F9VY09_9ACTN|nr:MULTISPECIES: SHOCT domain-containing protein [Gordonia]ETA08289.1 hypothetical protein V525_02485 [Gordonia alkanivorans CGMCC 6845]MDH3006031.1 SHOCT domain-containing protein [Gordonia alkanivorans]MDH3011352.1 SHOCT domain-containing protein [Gordonia alkanivorans]MDH3015786.1 SHOCT domain-containing protein [Gordonia alkanivorans]MDH3020760.1 SHOCT domain-containing protein [Gordonia alkanivorans]
MTSRVTPEAENAIIEIAVRFGLSRDAVLAMLLAVNAGGGTMAQFNIPELGGSGQWMRGGMTMVGDMFDNSLKSRVDSLCNELADVLTTTSIFPAAPGQQPGAGFVTAGSWWPADLGAPSSTGGQNDVRYAVFPATRRLAIQVAGVTRIFDTADHRIGGVQQQQGSGYGSVSFSSQYGTFDVSSLVELGPQRDAGTPVAAPAPSSDAPAQPPVPAATPEPAAPAQNSSAIVAAIESLADLHQRGILTDEEFSSKKAELLNRL